jgi:predicted nucleic acid-binding protein
MPVDVQIFRLWAKMMHGRPAAWAEDALIAATAAVHRLTVVTRDETDFHALGIATFNPFVDRR